MMNERVKEFSIELDALCKKHRVFFEHEDGHGAFELIPAVGTEEGEFSGYIVWRERGRD